jgi:hypothetical protein
MSAPVIVSAWYGGVKDTEGKDVTEIVKDHFATGNTEIEAINYYMGGDPQHLVRKTLWITYSLDGGETTKVVSAAEQTTIQLSDLC